MKFLLEQHGYFTGWLIATGIFYVRYLLAAGTAFLFFYCFFPEQFKHRKIQARLPKGRRMLSEMKHSFYTALIFVSVAIGLYFLQENGYTRLYMEISTYGIPYFLFTAVLLIFIHDTYFYWAHRLMHHPRFFWMHKEHHRSRNPTPWTSFDFHPVEAVMEIAFVPVLVFILPLHPAALFFLSFWLLAWNIVGHLGYELFPEKLIKHPLLKWLNTSTHHNLHHQRANYNFGLYFNFWDRLMGTNDPGYEALYEKITSQNPPKKPKEINHPARKSSKQLLTTSSGFISKGRPL